MLYWLRHFSFKYVIDFGPLWFCGFHKIYAIWHNDFQKPEQFHSLVQIFPIQPISSFICKIRHFVFLTMVCDVHIFIQLHGKKLECDATLSYNPN